MVSAASIIDCGSVPPQRPPGRLGYVAAMLSMAAFDAAMTAIFAVVSGRPETMLVRAPETLLFLVALTLAGARRIYRPVALCAAGRGAPEAAAQRLTRLARDSALLALVTGGLFSAWAFIVAPILLFDAPPTSEVLALLVSRALVWIVLLPFLVYFLVHDHARLMLRWIFETHGVTAPPGDVRLGGKLALILGAGAVAPGLAVAATMAFVPPISPITGLPRETIVLVTLLGGAVALSVAFWSVERAMSESVRSLTGALDAIRAGDVAPRLAVETDDELGRLSAGVNALAAALEESRRAEARSAAERAEAATMFHEAQKQSALGQLAAGVAHDFNNILTIVLGYTQSARKRMSEDDPSRKRLGEVLSAAERGRALIAQILAFARAGSPERKPVNVSACAGESVEWLRTTLGATYPIRFSTPPGPVMILGEPASVHQIVANLCINASHAMVGGGRLDVCIDMLDIDGGRAEGLLRRGLPKGPQLHVESTPQGGARAWVGVLRPGPHARLSVADVGKGMDAATLRRVFEPYFTTKAVGEGSGLGLAAVHGVVSGWSGAIAVQTLPAPADGHGTRFEVFLPLAPATGD